MYNEKELFINVPDTGVRSRIRIEQKIVKHIVKSALDKGYFITVHDGEEYTLTMSKNKKAIHDALMTTDEDNIILYSADKTRLGFIYFVYGNDGVDVVSDYATSLESFMQPINEWVDKI